MCAFYFAAAHNKAFNNLAHKYLKQLQRQSEGLYVSQMEENLCTSLLQAHDRAKLLQETQEAAQRLQLALNRIWKGDKHLPPWGPPLLPGDRPVEQVKEWSFPIPWTVVLEKDPKSYIIVATATTSDPNIRSREGRPEDAAKLGIFQPTAVFWGAKQTDVAPATVACEAIDRAGAALATAASSSKARAGTIPARATPRGAVQAGGARIASGSSSTARVGASQTMAASRSAARAAGNPATAAPGSTYQSSMPHAAATTGASARVSAGSSAEALGNKVRTNTSLPLAAQKSTFPRANQYAPPNLMESTEKSRAVLSLPTAAATGGWEGGWEGGWGGGWGGGGGGGGGSATQTNSPPTQRVLSSTTRGSKAASDNSPRGYVTPAEGRSESPALADSPRARMPRQR